MTDKSRFDRRQLLQLGAGAAAAGLAITPEAIAQAPKGGPLQPFNIANTSGISGATLVDMAQRLGYLEKYGIDAKIIPVSDGVKILSAVISGDVDMVRAAGFGQTLTAIEKGGALKVICGAGLLVQQAVYTTRPEIKSLKDLEGRVVGTGAPGALLHHMMTALLKKSGVDPGKVTFVNVGSSSDVFRAVVAGTVDAGPGQIDVYGEQEKWKVHSIAEFWNELPDYPYQAGFTSDNVIAKKRDLIVRTLAGFGELYRFLQTPASLDAFMKSYAVATGGRGDSSAEYQWQFFQKYKPYGLLIPEKSVDYLQKLNIDAGIQEKMIPMDKILDLSMARDALKMIGSS